MIKVSVDNQELSLESPQFSKVKECLTEVLKQLPETRVVTEVRLDGNPMSKQVDGTLLDKSLEGAANLEVITADREVWATNGVDMALSRIEQMKSSLIKAAELFREEEQMAEATLFFSRCMDGLIRFTETILITREALKLDFDQIQADGTNLSKIEQELHTILKSILRYQEKKENESIADKIEYELLTNLYRWKTALISLRQSCQK